jgi:Rad3-related DNA helicase
MEYFEYPSSFPSKRSPVYRIPTTRVDRHMEGSAKALWLSRIDQIVARRLDRKGIIHCVSYARADEIIKGCDTNPYMTKHTPEDTASTLEWFRACKPPMVLVSPAVTTGYDFAGRDAEFQIIAKVPYPDNRAKVMQARGKEDPLYIPYLTVQHLIQATGRGMRYAQDRVENFIVDDHIARLLAASRPLFLDWWMKLYHRVDTVPEPPPSLEVEAGAAAVAATRAKKVAQRS